MTILEVMEKRHSVRSYKDIQINSEIITELQNEINDCNNKSGLNIQLITNEPEAFGGFMAHYGKFSGVKNYIALVGKKDKLLNERLGYFGEKIVLKAQQLGLNTCWVALTFSKKKSACKINKDEKLVCVISLGYGETQGIAHKSKKAESFCNALENTPQWFTNGLNAAMLAPTATNQQKFFIELSENRVNIKPTGGFYSDVDIGIVKYHFEIGAGNENFKWNN